MSKRQWVEPVEYDATVQQYRPVKVDLAAMRDEKHASDDAFAYPTSLEQWIPISGKATVWKFEDLGTPLRITGSTSVATTSGSFLLLASPDLRPGEFAVVQTERKLSAEGQATRDRLYAEYTLKPTDPLDVEYDGLRLRELLVADEVQRRGECTPHVRFTPAQRAAVSAHWSAELRAKVAAAKERERNRVTMEYDE